jgi:WD repeat-containing protein 42A
MYQLVREREQYAFSERHCRRLLSSNPACVQRMELQQKLEGHNGCVNTVSFDTEAGDILISGSDDMQIMLWDWERGGCSAELHSTAIPHVLPLGKVQSCVEGCRNETCSSDTSAQQAAQMQ